MSTSDLKLKLIAQIIATNDNFLLDRIEETIASNLLVNEPPLTYERTGSEKIHVFNEWQRKRIDIALKQVENGECISDEKAQKEIEKWFEEQQ